MAALLFTFWGGTTLQISGWPGWGGAARYFPSSYAFVFVKPVTTLDIAECCLPQSGYYYYYFPGAYLHRRVDHNAVPCMFSEPLISSHNVHHGNMYRIPVLLF